MVINNKIYIDNKIRNSSTNQVDIIFLKNAVFYELWKNVKVGHHSNKEEHNYTSIHKLTN